MEYVKNSNLFGTIFPLVKTAPNIRVYVESDFYCNKHKDFQNKQN